MDVWTPKVGDENLYLEPEDGNEYDKNAVVVIIDGKTGGHIPKNLSKTFKRFLTLPNCTIKCTVIGKRVNHGAGYALEIPVNFKFLGPAKAIQWAGNSVKIFSKYFKEILQRKYMSFYVNIVFVPVSAL